MKLAGQIRPISYLKVHAAEYVLLIADGRRDMQTLLQRRLLPA